MTASLNSLGFAKPPSQTRVVVAMSGGVDSSVVAALLQREGYDVIGITLQLYDHGAAISRKGACCAGQDIHDARNVADRLGIPHYVLDYESRFRQAVIDEFAESYVRGETPIPCIRCNQRVKFKDLLETARDLGADCLATGHYVQRLIGADGAAELHRGQDPRRDQSYFLYATTREQLDYLRFPLGHMEKPAVRALAEEFGLLVADKPDSQDICFVPNGDYAGVVAKLRPDAAEPGEIVDLDGRVLGRHDGVIHYTVGQRKGLGIAASEPLYVVRLDAIRRQVIVGPKAALARSIVYLRELNWLGGPIPAEGLEVSVKLRSAQPVVAARIFRRR
jgi:tRNA (5-methylaminomethyl-2-thiouridylate)-methyltransferase